MEHDRRTTDKRVSPSSTTKEITRICRKIAEIGIICGMELGKTMRIGDNTRQTIMSSVSESIEEAKDAVTSLFADFSSRVEDTVESELMEVLKAAKKNKAGDLTRC
ncbi:hypothetical protein Q1695_000810 [Nippostrongylus brasiliensis]|nr:hypothetical protein Q1695_000810 [Nippostrongylus brasiliensis]